MSVNNNTSRKRRSSILKTKPRAPFAELEFNPPTPEVSAKSRRVSFSRKTGVAEFVVNEATTTWRNVYEEQNRTLESSGNDSEVHKHSVSRSIHQQFHEVEAEIDHTTLGNPGLKSGAIIAPFSDMNFTEQFANLDCFVNDNPVKPPVKNLEMSAIVQRTNTFTNSFQVPVISEHTGRIGEDFSMMQFATQKDLEDDLSDIAKDVEQSNRSIVGQNSFMQDFNRSCYIEVDLNETKGLRRNDISDMSITDTIQSPKFQASKNLIDAPQSKSTNLDWIIDKENIVVESFPKPATETIHHSEENVLVFDGKKLKVANINDKLDDILNEPIPERKTLNRPKTGQFNSNFLSQISDDILKSQSNDIGMENVSKINVTLSQDTSTHQLSIHKSMSHQMSMMPDMSLVNNCIENPSMNITNKVPGISIIEKSFNINKSMGIELTEGTLGHVSTTRLPRLTSESKLDIVNTKTKLVSQKEKYCDSSTLELEIPIVQLAEKPPILSESKPTEPPKRKTIILNQDDDLPNFTLDIPPQFDQRSLNSFHKNFVFDTEDSMPSMSTTQAILREIQEASGMFENADELRKNVEDDAMTNVSMTKADNPLVGTKIVKDTLFDTATKEVIQQNIETMKTRQTIVDQDKEDHLADLSTTVPSNPVGHENHPLIVFDKETDNAETTKPFPTKPMVQENRHTVFDGINMSITKPIQTDPLVVQHLCQTIFFDKENHDGNMSVTQAIPTEPEIQIKHPGIVFDKENNYGNMAITKAIPTKLPFEPEKHLTTAVDKEIYDGNMCVTHAIPAKEIVQQKLQTIVFDRDNDDGNMSVTQAILTKPIGQQKRQTIVFNKENDEGNMSVTQAIQTKPIVQHNRETLVFGKENYNGNMSIKQAIQNKPIVQQKHQTIVFEKANDEGNMSVTQSIQTKPIVQQKRQTIIFDKENDDGNMSVTQAITTKEIVQQKRQTKVFDRDNDDGNMSVTQAILTKPILQQKCQTIVFDKSNNEENMSVIQSIQTKPIVQQKRQTIIFDKENDDGNMSVTQAIPTKEIVQQKRRTIVFDRDNDDGNMSVTQAIPTKSIYHQEHETIVLDKENNNGNMSITQAIPSKEIIQQKRQTIVYDRDNDDRNMSVTQAILTKPIVQQKRQTIIFDKENDDGNMSVTQAIPSKEIIQQKRQTIVYDRDNDDRNMSVTQAILTKPIVQQKRQTIIFDKENDDGNMSVTQAIPTKEIVQQKRRTIVFDIDNDNGNMSVTQAIPSKEIIQQKRQTIVYDRDNDDRNMSVTQAILTKPIVQQKRQTIIFDKENDDENMSVTQAIPTKEIVQQKRRTIVFDRDNDDGNMSVTQAILTKPIVQQKRQTVVFDKENFEGNMSVTQGIPSKPLFEQVKCQTIVFDKESDDGNMSMTQDVPKKLDIDNKKKSQIIIYDENDDLANISITQAVASAISNDKWRQTLFEQMNEVPVTLANKAITIVDKQNTLPKLSITQRILDKNKENQKSTYGQSASVSVSEMGKLFSQENDQSIHYNCNDVNMDKSHELITDKSKIYDRSYHMTDISVTQAIPRALSKEKGQFNSFLGETKPDVIGELKHKTIVCNKNEEINDEILSNSTKPHVIVSEEKCVTIIYEKDTYLPDISVTKSLAENKSVVCERNSELIYETDHHIPNVSVSQKLMNADLNLQTDINKSISGESNINKQSTNGKKSFLAQMINDDSEISINFLVGKSCDNVNSEITTCPDVIGKNQEIERIEEGNVQSNILIEQQKIEVKEIITNQYIHKSVCTTQTPILEESIKETDKVTKNTNENTVSNTTKPHAIVSEEKCVTIIYEKDTYLPDISVTKSLAENKSVVCERNSELIYETDHQIANVSVSQKQINTDLNLQTAINKSISRESNINKQSTSGKKSFLAQMLNDDSEITIDFLDGKTRDNVHLEMTTCPDETEKIQEILRTGEDYGQSNTVIDEKKIEVDKIITNQGIENKSVCMTQTPISEESLNKTDILSRKVENKTHILTNHQQILIDNTNEIIDMLTEAAEKIEQNQIESAQKGEPVHQQKRMTEESLEIVITDLDNANDKTHKIEKNVDSNEKVEKAPKQNECTTQNASDDNGAKNTLTIAYVNQAERIMTLNPTMDIMPSWDIITHKNSTNLNTQNPRAKISNEVVKTLNFEDESLEKSDYINISITGNNNKCKRLEQENHPCEFEKDLSMTNFEPPLCSTQRFSLNPGYLEKYMSNNKAGLTTVPSIAVQDDNAVVDKTYNIMKPNFKVPLIENNVTYQVTVAAQQRHIETAGKIENGSVKNTNPSVVKEGNAVLSTKNSEEMLDNMSCITLVDDSMDTDSMEPEKENINTQPEIKEQTEITDRTNHIMDHTSYPTPSNKNLNFTQTKDKDTALENHDIHTRKRLLSPGKEVQCNVSIGSTPNPPRKIHKMSNSPISDDIDQKSLLITNKDIAFKSHAHKEACLKMNSELGKTLSENSKFGKPILNEEQKVISQRSDEIILELNPPNKNDQSFIDNRNMDTDRSFRKNEQKNISSLINSSKHEHNIIDIQMSVSVNGYKKLPADMDFGDQKSKKMSFETDLGEKEPKLEMLEINLSKNGNEKIVSPENSINSSKTEPAQVDMAESKRIPCDMNLCEIKPKEKHSQINLNKVEYHKVDTKTCIKNYEQNNICESLLSEKNPKEISSQINLNKSVNQKVPFQIDLDDDEQNKIPTDIELCKTMDVCKENCKSKMWDSIGGIEEFKSQVIEEINNLHFMGTWVCRWAECTESDMCFTLLHDRIRLRVRLESSGTGFVLPETSVLNVDVTEAISDSRPIASQATTACLALLRRLAMDACVQAGDVAALLIRCSAVLAKTAAWARSMRHAKAHLAYKINGDILTLEVANVPLLSVWSLSLRITYESKGPRANDVRVTSVCSKYQISDRTVESVSSGVEEGWDNVPQTVWKMFKYLKHKSKDDDPLTFLRSK